MKILFVGLQIVLIATLALASLVAPERSWALAVCLFLAGGLRVFALRCLSLALPYWAKMIYLSDALFAAPVLALVGLVVQDQVVNGVHNDGLGTALIILALPLASSALAWRIVRKAAPAAP